MALETATGEVAFLKKTVLKNFAIFAGKHQCWGLFFNNMNLYETPTQVFPVNIAKLLKTSILKNINK